MKQLGNAVVALVIMLACAALSERFIPGVASQEAVAPTPMMAADTTTVVKTTFVEETPAELTPRVPEYLVMLLVGTVLLGLGGAFRTPRRDR